MLLTTLKNYITECYNSEQNRINHEQKVLLRGSLLDMFYEIKHNHNAVGMYKQILYLIAIVDFPWAGLDEQLMEDLNTRIEAGVYLSRQIAKKYEYLIGPDHQPLDNFIIGVFPKLETIVEQVLSNYNENTNKLLE